MAEYAVIEDSFNTNEFHNLDSILDRAIVAYEAAAFTFAKDAIADANTRQWYMKNIKRVSSTVKTAVTNGEISVKEGAEFCNKLRNSIMEEARAMTSVQGRKYVESKKKSGLSLETLEKYYGEGLFKQKFSDLTPKQKDEVYKTIIDASGRDRPKFTSATKKMKIMGRVCILVTGVLAVQAVYSAENRPKETIRQGAIIGGGAVGGAAGGLAASAFCGPGAWVCAIGFILLGGISGGFIADKAVDIYDEELEEFTRWMAE
jgi:23S rRNA maturation mini-RNase III